MKEFDVVVIGGGPGGYVSAIRLSQLGFKVGLVEKEHLGGICLNWGCIPTKALLHSAEVYRLIKESSKFGIEVSNPKLLLDKMIDRSKNVAHKLSSGVSMLMKKNKIEVINGVASFVSNNHICVTNNKDKIDIKSGHFVIATGARARNLPKFESDGDLVMNYKNALSEKKLPKEILIVGTGAIGMEFASFYSTLGSKVTVLDLANRVMPAEDEEISSLAHKSFIKQGINFKLGIQLLDVEKKNNSVLLKYKQDNKECSIKADKLLMAVGVIPNVEELDLQNVNIEQVKSGHIKVDSKCKTNIDNIYAIGDVAATFPSLAHKASHEGIMVAEIIANKKVKPINYSNVPSCTYTHPQVASLGITEKQALEEQKDIMVGRFSAIGNGKAIAIGEEEGFIKVIFDKKYGEILGVHMLGAGVTEMIQGFGIAKTAELTEEDIVHTIFPHPTISEIIPEAVLDAMGVPLHK